MRAARPDERSFEVAHTYNPQDAPRMHGYDPAPPMTSAITPLMVEHLRGARGFIQLISILCFLCAGVMVLASLLAGLAGVAFLAAGPRPGRGMFGPLLGLVYLPFAAFYILPGVMLHRLCNAIDAFTARAASSTLEDVLDKHRAFWRALGIQVLVIIGLTVLMTVGGFVFGIAAALMK
jgi:hypothetical protein